MRLLITGDSLCRCGCGEQVKPNSTWKRGHSNKGSNNPNYGIKPSDETRRKISTANKGRKFSDEHKANISKAAKLRKYKKGKEHHNHGRKLSSEHKRKISETLKRSGRWAGSKNPMWGKFGELNPNWKGGKSHEHRPPIWFSKKFRDSIKERDGWRCQNPLCSRESIMLAIHHIDYDKKNCSEENLITLCLSCNARSNFNEERWRLMFKAVLRERGLLSDFY